MITKEQLKHHAKPVLLYGLLPLALLVAVISAGSAVYAQAYSNKIFPNVFVGSVNVGGLSVEDASAELIAHTQSLLQDGIKVTDGKETKTIDLVQRGIEDPDAFMELARWDTDALLEKAMDVGRDGNLIRRLFRPLLLQARPVTLNAQLTTLHTEYVTKELETAFPNLFANPPADAGFVFIQTTNGWTAEVTAGHAGVEPDVEGALKMIQASMERLEEKTITLASTHTEPIITTEIASKYLPEALTAVSSAPYTLTYSDASGDKTWELDAQTIADNLAVTVTDNTLSLGFKPAFADVLNTLLADIIVPAQDAKLTMENGKVKEFQGSKTGVALDTEATEANLVAVLRQTNQTVPIVVVTTEPEVTIGDVNELGINQVLGVGVSKFKGSPTNRIKNIQNGARLLNGTLIEPGEEFSLLTKLGPFTEANGYYPELVIKGDEIKPEVGGGLCQIGTTTFRAAMNSGLPITARSNHSLVVSYYNDLSNGNPGTDATIYDPAPDLKFVNDTRHTILFVTDMDLATSTLTFTFWGTSDGRKGSYSPPVVERWIPAGEKRVTETLTLEPGKTKCQAVHPGADTTFTYTILHPDGTKTDKVFTSHYRALPEICLVGVEELSQPATEDPSTDPPEDAPEETTSTPTEEPSQNFPSQEP